MPKTGEVNRIPGVYRSKCCQVEFQFGKNEPFPVCLMPIGCGKPTEWIHLPHKPLIHQPRDT